MHYCLRSFFFIAFVYVGKNSSLKGSKKFIFSLNLALLLMFSNISPARAKGNFLLPGADGFQITRVVKRPPPSGAYQVGRPSNQNPTKPPRMEGIFKPRPSHLAARPGGGPPGGGPPGDESGNDANKPSNGNNQNPPSPTDRSGPTFSNGSKKKKKPGYELLERDGVLILKIMRDDMPFFISETTALKKIYHAIDFGIELPDNIDLNHVKKLKPRERIRYLKENLPQTYVSQYMIGLGKHLRDPQTQLLTGTIGGQGRWKTDPIKGTHTYNKKTGMYAFFNDNGFSFHTAMKLNEDQIEELFYTLNLF